MATAPMLSADELCAEDDVAHQAGEFPEVNPPSERDFKIYELVCIRFRSVEAVARKFDLAPPTVRNIVRQTRDKLARERFELATHTRQGSIQLAYDRLGYQAKLLTDAF